MASRLDTLLWYTCLIFAKSLFFQELANTGMLIEFKLRWGISKIAET